MEIQTIMPLCIGTGGESVVHSILLFDKDNRIIKVYASERFLRRLSGETVTATLLLGGDDLNQAGAMKVIEEARDQVDMIEFEPWRVKSWGLDAAIEEAWRAHGKELGDGKEED